MADFPQFHAGLALRDQNVVDSVARRLLSVPPGQRGAAQLLSLLRAAPSLTAFERRVLLVYALAGAVSGILRPATPVPGGPTAFMQLQSEIHDEAEIFATIRDMLETRRDVLKKCVGGIR